MTDVSEFSIEKYDGTVYTYPAWAQWTGRILAASTIACIPLGAVVALIKARVRPLVVNVPSTPTCQHLWKPRIKKKPFFTL